MSYSWREDEEELRVGGIRAGLKAKPRFSFTEVKVLLEAVKRNRYIILKKFNQGVSAESKKQTWAKITDQINNLGENHREVRQIMKKWADLKCDGKRRIAALRGPNGCNLRKKHLGPVERMVHKILMMSPGGDVDSDLDFGDEEDFLKLGSKGPSSSYSYIGLTDNLSGSACHDLSPLSSPEKEPSGEPFHSSSEFDLDLADDGEHTMDYDDNDDSMFSYRSAFPPPASASLDPLPDNSLPRIRPIYTYSRNSNQNHNHIQNSTNARPPSGPSCSSVASTSSVYPSVSDSDVASSSIAPPPLQSPSNSSITVASLSAPLPSSFPFILPPASPSSSLPSTLNDSTSHAASSTSSIPPPAPNLPAPPPLSAAPAPPAVSAPPTVSSSSTSSSAPSAPSFSVPPLPQSTSSSISHQPVPSSSSSSSAPPPNPSSTSSSTPSDPLPPGASSRRSQDQVAQLATQSLQQQRASRMLLASVSQSLETLAQSVQLLVESQQEFVQESLLLQRETVDILRDFSNTALTMLREKSISGQVSTQHHPASHF